MYADEFERIRKAQSPHHALAEADWNALRDRYILFQHPLRPVERGACSIYPDQPRAHRDTPIAQRFRIFKEVANLRWLDTDLTSHSLTQDQHRAITQRLLSQKSASFSSFRSLKGNDGHPLFAKDSRFNLEDERRTGLDGDRIGAMMRNHPALAPLWEGRDAAWLGDLFEFLHTPLRDGRLLDDDELRLALTQDFAVSAEQARALAGLPLSSITVSLSRKAMEDLLPFLEDHGLDEHDACVELLGEDEAAKRLSGFQSEPERFPKLPYYGQILGGSVLGADPRKSADTDPEGHFGRIGNPTVHIALNQLRKLVNELIDRFGEPPAAIHVELSRDLKLPRKKREEINATIRDNEAANKKRAEKWRDLSNGQGPSPTDLKKMKLWEELGRDELSRRCVFTGRVIAAHHLINGEVEIEHLLPRSRTLDDGLGNLTLSFRDANRIKGNQTPFEAFGHDQHAERGMIWKEILDRASRLPPNKRRKFSATAMNDWEVETDFIARQMTDNAHIARAARRYLTAVCDDVMPSPGRLTAMIRGQWSLNGLLSDDNQKNRTDHRHHTIDAFVIGLADRSLLQRVSTARGADDRVRVTIPELPESLRNALRERLETLVVSFKPDHGGQGGMFNETAYGFIKGPGDSELPGYNLVTRKKLTALSDKETGAIRDPLWRAAIADVLRDNGYGELAEAQKKKKLPELLAGFGKAHGIKTIRILVTNASVRPVPSAPFKGYAKGEYACCDIWALPAGKPGKWKKGETVWQGIFWSYADCRDGQVPPPPERKPHPAAKFVMRLFKNDMVGFDENGQTRIMRVGGYATMANKLDLRPFRDAAPVRTFSSINTLGKMNLRKVGISVSGQVRDPKARRS
jgi:CRISPR-associated endonuclease Csn1